MEKREKRSNSGVLITPLLTPTVSCRLGTNPTISLHGFVKHRCLPNLKESRFILPSCLRSFYGRHSINICYLKKFTRAQKHCWKVNPVWQKPEFMLSLLECNTFVNALTCPDHHRHRDLPPSYLFMFHFLFQQLPGKTEVGVSLALGRKRD